jgi:hypothetical protein
MSKKEAVPIRHILNAYLHSGIIGNVCKLADGIVKSRLCRREIIRIRKVTGMNYKYLSIDFDAHVYCLAYQFQTCPTNRLPDTADVQVCGRSMNGVFEVIRKRRLFVTENIVQTL